MFDASPAAAEADWQTTLSHGDVVVFRFHVDDAETGAKPKPRPCLVMDLVRIGDARFVLLAYGTTARVRANPGLQIRVSGPEAAEAGLRTDTAFIGGRRILVPLTHRGFDIAAQLGSPVIGRISGAAFERLNHVRARLDAQRDILADRRHERRRRRTASLAKAAAVARRAASN